MSISDASRREPNQDTKRRRNFNFSRSKLPVIIIVLLMLYISFSLGSRFDQLYAMQRNLEDMQTEIKDLRDKNAGLYEQLERLQSDDYIEQVAREKLGLVKPGEARIVTVPPGSEEAQQTPPDSEIKD
ncbi:FtsB family cell division protein [Desulfoscipio gibsoniae]|uniref:Septum formation initiator n=1 Tax=Desulfoscipio gibsoniae DSM 7213 TaxID=767817 RepID=R4K9B9_9FIRM|nr:septum formation initiator family protein [Desulfoscipio gibsoniae]AGK99767.1 septum formation initiator [Desulfoscipio gibsoniae DSM 7213]